MKNLIAATLMTLLIISGFYQINLDSADSDFERWAKQHGKKYYGDEKTYRQAIYYQNKQMIEEHNKRTDVTYLMGENQFTGITNEEFINLYLIPRPSQTQNDEDQIKRDTNPQSPLPNQEQKLKIEADWRGWVTVKNQGNCGSSWAIASTGVIEGKYATQKRINIIVSAQNIMDCDKPQTYSGCDASYKGNDVDRALWYVYFSGIYSESSYPYIGRADQWCQVNTSSKGPWTIRTHMPITIGDNYFEFYLKESPVTTKVDATKWQYYSSGVFSDCSSSVNQGNYYAIIVGFTWPQYWIVQPSFGKGWGESGYIRLAYGNTCGLQNEAYEVTLNG